MAGKAGTLGDRAGRGELGGEKGLETPCCARSRACSQNTGSRLEQILRYLHRASSREVGPAGLSVLPLEPRLSHPRHVEVKLLPQPKTFLGPKTLCEAEKLPRLPYLLPYFWAGGQAGEEAESHLHNLPAAWGGRRLRHPGTVGGGGRTVAPSTSGGRGRS